MASTPCRATTTVCPLITLPVITDPRGNLAFIQQGAALPLPIARCSWLYDMPYAETPSAAAQGPALAVALSGSFRAAVAGEATELRRSCHAVSAAEGQSVLIDMASTNAVALLLEQDPAGSVADEERPDHSPSHDPHGDSSVDACRVLQLPTRATEAGTVTEPGKEVPFRVKRVFYLFDVPSRAERGGHSHFEDQQLIVAACGSFTVVVDDGKTRREVTLSRPDQGLYIPAGIWRELRDFSSGSICLVLTSEPFAESDYVREYSRFLELTAPKRGAAVPFLDLAAVNAPAMPAIEQALLRVARSGRYVGGPEVESLEKALAAVAGTPYAVGVSNGLDALRLIFKAYIQMGRLAPGDEVIVPANTYIASVLAVTDCGLMPVFCDPDPKTMNLTSADVQRVMTPRTRAVLVVHLYGRACWDEGFTRLAQEGMIIVEDNAQAIGASASVPGLLGHNNTGGLGHAAAFSFYPTKNIGALGDAGAITTADAALATTARALANYGSDRRYHNIYAGYNCRLDPVQAAVLTAKLPGLDAETARRREIAAIYDAEIQNPAVVKPQREEPDGQVWHQYVVRTPRRDALREHLSALGIGTDINYPLPPHRQPCYAQFAHLHLPVADEIAATCLSLPINSAITPHQAREVARAVNSFAP